MKLSELLEIKYPIVQGGMAHIASGAFAAEISKSGALGVIAAGGLKPEELRAEIVKYKSITHLPFAVNLMIQSRYIEEWNQILIDEDVKIVTTGAGNPSPYIPLYKEHGIKVFPVVSNAKLVSRILKLDIDGLIVEGMEAGGHIGNLTTMVTMPEIRKLTDLPIIAAGGIGNGSQMLAAEALGADGVQIGTILLGSSECPIHEEYKNRLIKASSNHTTIVGNSTGFPARVIRNPMSREYNILEKKGVDKWELEEFLVGGLKKAVRDGDWKNGSFMAGQVVGQIEELQPVEKIIVNLYEEYQKQREKLCINS